ncbi:MAG: peptidyl-prolyl cis-trans isomerase [Lysobacteraceae bacterium]|nr:MAG: peptidyl-prolyl cis-trans isomerase [Xanthomonadaceae bacterium]
MGNPRWACLILGWIAALPCPAAPGPTTEQVLAASTADEWVEIPPEHLLLVELASGRALVELAPQFAPEHVANLRRLARQHYFDGLAVVRVQDNYVVQWGDPDAADPARRRSLGKARERLPAEFDRAVDGLPFEALLDPDPYAAQTGFTLGFPVGRDAEHTRTWLLHCYGALGAGRDAPADSSNAAELYVVIGHAPRHLDRNVTLLGRVIEGMEHLATLPRGEGPMGFYRERSRQVPVLRVRIAADLPEAERPRRARLDTHSRSFRLLIEARRHRREPWFAHPVGHVEACNVPIPVRALDTR